MKKKFFIGIAMSLFAVATVFNMNIAEQSNASDISLDAIEVMAQAEAEITINAPWAKVCHPRIYGRCTWRAISNARWCDSQHPCYSY